MNLNTHTMARQVERLDVALHDHQRVVAHSNAGLLGRGVADGQCGCLRSTGRRARVDVDKTKEVVDDLAGDFKELCS